MCVGVCVCVCACVCVRACVCGHSLKDTDRGGETEVLVITKSV